MSRRPSRRGRVLRVESLERRQVLTTMVMLPPPADAPQVSPWHNEIAPQDVNRDGAVTVRDAAAVLSGLAQNGSLALSAWPGGQGESLRGRSGPQQDVDVDGDRHLTPRDAQRVLSDLFLHGERDGIRYDRPAPSDEPVRLPLTELPGLRLDQWLPEDAQSEPGGDVHPDNDRASATPIPMDDSGSFGALVAAINSPGDVDLFRFSVPSAGDYTLNGFGFADNLQLEIEVLNAAGEVLAAGAGSEWLPAMLVIPGLEAADAYFIRVRGNGVEEGEYMLSLLREWMPPTPPTIAPDAVLGDDIHPDQLGPGAAEIQFEMGMAPPVSSHIDFPGDIDVRIATTTTAGVLTISELPGPSGNIAISVFDASGQPLSRKPDGLFRGAEHILEFDVTAGEYFLQVAGVEEFIGQYAVEVLVFPADPLRPIEDSADSRQGDDPHVDEIGRAATPLSVGEERISFIDRPGDRDVFRLADPGGFATVTALGVRGGELVQVEIRDLEGGLVRQASPGEALTVAGGQDYFVIVRAEDPTAVGDYLLSVAPAASTPPGRADSRPGEDPHVDDLGPAATRLQLEETLPGVASARVTSFIDAAGDRDVFQAELPAGMEVSALVLSEQVLVLTVSDEQGNPLQRFRFDPERYVTPQPLPPGPGRVFLSVHAEGSETGRYTLLLNGFDAWRMLTRDLPADAPAGEDLHGDDRAGATPLPELYFNEVHSNLDGGGDVDAFRIRVGAPHLRSALDVLLRGRDIDLVLEVRDATGRSLHRERVAANQTFSGLLQVEGDQEELLILVSAADGESAGEYYLRAGLPMIFF